MIKWLSGLILATALVLNGMVVQAQPSQQTYGPWPTQEWTRPLAPTACTGTGVSWYCASAQVLYPASRAYVGLVDFPQGVRATHWTYWLMTEGGGVRVGVYGVQGSIAQLVAQIAGPGKPQPLVTVEQDILLAPGRYAVLISGDGTGTAPMITTYRTAMMDGLNLYPRACPDCYFVEGRLIGVDGRVPLPESFDLGMIEPARDSTPYLILTGG